MLRLISHAVTIVRLFAFIAVRRFVRRVLNRQAPGQKNMDAWLLEEGLEVVLGRNSIEELDLDGVLMMRQLHRAVRRDLCFGGDYLQNMDFMGAWYLGEELSQMYRAYYNDKSRKWDLDMINENIRWRIQNHAAHLEELMLLASKTGVTYGNGDFAGAYSNCKVVRGSLISIVNQVGSYVSRDCLVDVLRSWIQHEASNKAAKGAE